MKIIKTEETLIKEHEFEIYKKLKNSRLIADCVLNDNGYRRTIEVYNKRSWLGIGGKYIVLEVDGDEVVLDCYNLNNKKRLDFVAVVEQIIGEELVEYI